MSDSLTFTQQIEVEPTAVYYALTHSGALREWLCTVAHVENRVGGRIYLWWPQGYYAAGEFTQLEPGKAVALRWLGKDEAHPTTVTIALVPVDGGTAVQLTHAGLGEGELWQPTRTEWQKGWQIGLENLKSVLETGLDKRLFDRPMLGIFIGGEVGAAEMEAMSLPAAGGIRLGGTIDGSGAAALGLQAGDILVEMAGHATVDLLALQTAVQPHRAGDQVKIAYYRDGEKQSGLLQLGRRPTPVLPASPADFAEQLQDVYAQLDGELDALLADVTEAEASYHPAAGEWSVKDVLAHLITTERGVQMGLATQLTDGVQDGYPDNPGAWIHAVTAVYPTLADVLALWKRTEAETVALVAELPAAFVARKATYLNAVINLLQGLPGHTRAHFTQIQEAVAAARAQSLAV